MIELKNIHIRFQSFSLTDVSLNIEESKFHVLLGPTGSGKTILLETITGILKPAHGRIYIQQKDATDLLPEHRNISYLPQDYSLFPHKNVYENIAFGLKIRKFTDKVIHDKVTQMASLLNISHLLNRSIYNLSGGEQQRVALARALVLNNPVLILDEPTSSIHEAMQENFCLLLKKLQKQFNLTILITTHHKDSAFMVADVLHFIDNGKILLSADIEKINHIPLPLKVAELLGISNVITMRKTENDQNIYYCSELNTNFHFTPAFHKNLTTFKIGIKPVDIRIVKKNEEHLNPVNSFYSIVEHIIFKENDAIVFINNLSTNFQMKIELSAYHLNKMNISAGSTILCKIKEEYIRMLY